MMNGDALDEDDLLDGDGDDSRGLDGRLAIKKDNCSLPTHEALRLALDQLRIKPSDLLAALRASASPGEPPVARSTVSRWLSGASPVPAAVKLWLRDRLVLSVQNGMPMRLEKPIVVAIAGAGGIGKTPVSLKLAHIAQAYGLRAVYLDATADLYNEAAMKAAVLAGRSALVVKSRDRLRDTLARINADAPHLVFVDLPVCSFIDDEGNDNQFEADLLEGVDHVLILTRLGPLDVKGALRVAQPLREVEVDWRLVLVGPLPMAERIADTVAAAKEAEARIAGPYIQAPPSYALFTDLVADLRTDANRIPEIADLYALQLLLDEILQEHGLSLEDSEVPYVDPEGSFESVVAALAS